MPVTKDFLTITIVFLPYIAYTYFLIWISNNHQEFIPIIGAITISVFYLFISIAFLVGPFVFYFRALSSKKLLTDWGI